MNSSFEFSESAKWQKPVSEGGQFRSLLDCRSSPKSWLDNYLEMVKTLHLSYPACEDAELKLNALVCSICLNIHTSEVVTTQNTLDRRSTGHIPTGIKHMIRLFPSLCWVVYSWVVQTPPVESAHKLLPYTPTSLQTHDRYYLPNVESWWSLEPRCWLSVGACLINGRVGNAIICRKTSPLAMVHANVWE
jgi:hypothetical protein